MSAATTQEKKPVEDRSVKYTPIGSTEEIEISLAVVHNFIAHKTRSGQSPEKVDLVKFLMLCKANQLNPWTGDAYLIGYDTNDGPKFNMIVAAQALFKRAELNKDFNGIESGVIIRNAEGAVEYREGDFCILEDGEEKLLGGWARVYRKNCDKPFYDALRLGVYSTGRSRWSVDPAGMIVKVAESSVLRKAFPNTLSECYTREEMDHVIDGQVVPQGKMVEREVKEVRNLRDMVSKDRGAESEVQEKEKPVPSFQVYLEKVGSCGTDDDSVGALYHEIAMDDSLSQPQRDELVAKLKEKTGEN